MKLFKKERILIFSSFAIIWILLFSYGYKRYQELHYKDKQIVFFDEQSGTSKNTDLLQSSSYGKDDLFPDINVSKKQEGNSFFGKVANAEGNSFSNIEKDNNDINVIDQKIENIKKCGSFKCYTGEQFINIYNKFEDELGLKKDKKSIYGNKEIDSYIRKLAEKRGYKEHVFARSEDLIDFNQLKTRVEVKNAYISMRNEMKKNNISLHFVSGYRGAGLQKSIFLRKLGNIDINKILSGLYDEKIDKVLTRSSIPGYSKHHSGYTVDFGCGNDYLVYSFANTDCYEWMSENNFENTKRFGFIPSYPEGVEKQGPEPEPWEFVWVGVENIE